MESRNDKSGYVKKLGISLLAGYLVTLVGIFLLALCLFLFQITEEIVDIGIIVIYVASSLGAGFLAGKQLKTFPSKANITFQIGMHQFKDINADDFTVSISYNDLQTNTPNDHCELKVTKAPSSASHIRISPASVEYLIEQDN